MAPFDGMQCAWCPDRIRYCHRPIPNPAPATAVRVFVGRLELVTPATEKAVESAFAARDQPALEKYRRFLEPILHAMMA